MTINTVNCELPRPFTTQFVVCKKEDSVLRSKLDVGFKTGCWEDLGMRLRLPTDLVADHLGSLGEV